MSSIRSPASLWVLLSLYNPCGAREPQKSAIFLLKILLSLSHEGAESQNFKKSPSFNALNNEARI
ncbi:hypothetical protein CD31_01590 [Lysinibacillus boronitolerans JCM 21713 = 10a = NBRC 103108]|uniref:Secreted protein n=1 Tax=Lysinibacillus boronitolerans JCM 21713 = 10a = NBRC 103108 TaxID=1294264 RepID=A0ABR4Y641_9BACI|nr:hypothetical protein CD31_01590 [Lysinibacillus boronitolerans JCM 21713 = 10a = NBRC 103108]